MSNDPDINTPTPPAWNRKRNTLIIKAALVVFSVVLVVTALTPTKQPEAPQSAEEPPASSVSSTSPVSSAADLPVSPQENIASSRPYYRTDILFSTPERDNYAGGMILEIPRLDYTGPVLGDISDATLAKGVGLYDFSTLPGPANINANVSIAGHRDLHGNEFYYIDTLQRGDLMYLSYQGTRYTYEYETNTIIEPDDWSVIYCTDYSCLTLTSCDPIGVANKRIVVRAKLIAADPI